MYFTRYHDHRVSLQKRSNFCTLRSSLRVAGTLNALPLSLSLTRIIYGALVDE